MPAQNNVTHSWLLLDLLAGCSELVVAQLNALSETDWTGLMVEAQRQGVAPLVYRLLQALGPELSWPAAAQETLKALQLRIAVQNMQAYGQLLELVKALHGLGIPTVALKGIHLAQAVYGNVSLRPMTDLDILVKKDDLPQVEATLEALGYAAFEEEASRSWYLAKHYHVDYIRQQPDAKMIEVHWDLVFPNASFGIDLDGLWQRAQPAILSGTPITYLAPEDLLLHLCLQMTYQHLFDFYALRRFCDIAETIRRYEGLFDWPQFTARALAWGVANHVYLTLGLAHKWLGAAVPEDTLRKLEPQSVDPQLEHYAFHRMTEWYARRAAVPESDGFAAVWAAPNPRERFRAVARVMFPPASTLARLYALPDRSFHLVWTYPRHWSLMTTRHARRAWQLARREPEAMAWASGEAERVALEKWLAANPRLPVA